MIARFTSGKSRDVVTALDIEAESARRVSQLLEYFDMEGKSHSLFVLVIKHESYDAEESSLYDSHKEKERGKKSVEVEASRAQV